MDDDTQDTRDPYTDTDPKDDAPGRPPTPAEADAQAAIDKATLDLEAANARLTTAQADTASREEQRQKHTHPTRFVGIDDGAGGGFRYEEIVAEGEPDPFGKERTITRNGGTLEHVDTDADGVWLYRAM